MRISDWSSDVCSSDLGEMADDPGHPLRLKIEDSLAELAFDLQHDPAMRDRVFRLKAEMLDNPAIERWWMSMWEQMRRGLIGLVRDPNDALAGQFGAALRQLGETLRPAKNRRAPTNSFRLKRRGDGKGWARMGELEGGRIT